MSRNRPSGAICFKNQSRSSGRWGRELNGVEKSSEINCTQCPQTTLGGESDGGVLFLLTGDDTVKGIAMVDLCFRCCLSLLR